MLEEVGKRHGEIRGRFSVSTRADEHERRVEQQMTITFRIEGGRVEDEAPVDLLAEMELYFREAVEDLVRAIRRLKARPDAGGKVVSLAIKDLKAALKVVMDEGTRLGKLRKEAAGAVGDHALDFDAARDEIGRRLACLRDAGSDG